eukprot:GHVR01158122.1.p3 GENE.GHVR01158122.1~~GHVR01158122.1.p3  ORF type:complete len:114 (-),score=8.29 GHVR01158122.1:1093-1434(-)
MCIDRTLHPHVPHYTPLPSPPPPPPHLLPSSSTSTPSDPSTQYPFDVLATCDIHPAVFHYCCRILNRTYFTHINNGFAPPLNVSMYDFNPVTWFQEHMNLVCIIYPMVLAMLL